MKKALQHYFNQEEQAEQVSAFIQRHPMLWGLVEEAWQAYPAAIMVETEETPISLEKEDVAEPCVTLDPAQASTSESIENNTETLVSSEETQNPENDPNLEKGEDKHLFIKLYPFSKMPPIQPPQVILPRLINGKKGEFYEASLAEFRGGELMSVEVIPAVGIEWDKNRNVLYGTPQESGTLTVSFHFSAVGQVFTDKTDLYINADPRDMWQNIPSPTGTSFYKKDQANELITSAFGHLIAGRMRGRTHAHQGTCCDDDFTIAHHQASDLHLLVVSDGAGSAKFSREGSRLAVEAVRKKLFNLLDNNPNLIHLLKESEASKWETKKEWITKIFYHVIHEVYTQHINTVNQNQALGVDLKSLSCTLLFAFALPLDNDQWLTAGYWIGDGAAGLWQPEIPKIVLLGSADSGAYSGETQFLNRADVDVEAVRKRTHVILTEQAPVLILMTDGVSDPKFHSEANLANADEWQQLWQNDLQAVIKEANSAKALERWLDFWSAGEHDDRTLAMFVPEQYLQPTLAELPEEISIQVEQAPHLEDKVVEPESMLENTPEEECLPECGEENAAKTFLADSPLTEPTVEPEPVDVIPSQEIDLATNKEENRE